MRSITDFFRRAVLGALRWWSRRKLAKCVEERVLDRFLELLLDVMRLTLCLDADFRKNIEDFRGRYVFRTQNGVVAASAIFENGEMTVRKEGVADPNVAVTFADGAALCELLLSRDPDVFALVLDNKLSYEGNLNYVLKFGFMAKRLQHRLGF